MITIQLIGINHLAQSTAHVRLNTQAKTTVIYLNFNINEGPVPATPWDFVCTQTFHINNFNLLVHYITASKSVQ